MFLEDNISKILYPRLFKKKIFFSISLRRFLIKKKYPLCLPKTNRKIIFHAMIFFHLSHVKYLKSNKIISIF